MIDGDIDGLWHLEETLRAYAARVRDLAGRLSAVTRNLTEDDPGGWRGAAADAFTAAWSRQARAATALEDYVTAAAGVIGELAAGLSRIESAGQPANQARAAADAVRENAARQLGALHARVTAPGPHAGGALAALGAGGLLASPLAALGRDAHAEAELSRLVDTPVIDARAALAGTSALGRHAAGSTPGNTAAGAEPEAVKGVLGAAEEIPVLDVAATLAGTGIGSYYDIEAGQSPAAAIGGELLSNGAGTIAAGAAGGAAGAAAGARLGAAGGPVGLAAGAIVGYGAGDLTHNLVNENWSGDLRAHGVIDGTVHGAHHAADQTADDARELAVNAGHEAEHCWDNLFG